MFGNPVPGRILANKDPWGGPPTFRVTSTFAMHVASGRGPGIDIGNGREGDPVLTPAAGQITEVFIDPNGAVVVRMVHPQLAQYFGGKRVVTGYGHMQKIETRVGLVVAAGIAIGHVGSTGAPGQRHLHWGVNIGGTEVDGWPLLDQNQLPDSGTGGDVNLKGSNPRPIVNRTTHLKLGGNIVADCTATPYQSIQALPAGTAFTPSWQVTGNTILGTAEWYGGWIFTSPPQFGYLSLGLFDGPLVPLESGGGYTQAQLDAAVDKAEQEAGRTAAGAVAAASVSEAKKYGYG